MLTASGAFLDRFKLYEFTGRVDVAPASLARLAQVCVVEGIQPPTFLEAFDDDGAFSMRRAIDIVEDIVAEKARVVA